MHVHEVEFDNATVRGLLSEQFPQWSDLPLRRIPDSGTDNAIYRLGDDMGIRLPRIQSAVPQIDKECRWLGRLAEHLPVPVPVPIGRGEPGHGYPHPWLVYPWLGGLSLDRSAVETAALVGDVASFVLALHAIPTAGGPEPGRRGGPLAPHDREVEWALEKLEGLIDTARAREVWRAAREATSPSRASCGSTATCSRATCWWPAGDSLESSIGAPPVSAIPPATPCSPGACQPGNASATGACSASTTRRGPRARGWVVEQTALYIPYYAETLPEAVAQAKTRLEAALSHEP